MSSKPQTPWRNRIVDHGQEAPDQLLASPRNWRIHPKYQQDALAGVLAEVGWVQDVIVNRTTGHVVDGHARVAIAISRGEPTVPVVYVELEPDEEAKVLATFDPLGSLAATDRASLDALLEDVRVQDDALAAFLMQQQEVQPFTPNTSPSIGVSTHTAEDVAEARGKLEGAYTRQRELEPVMCPHCGGSFFLDK